MFKHTVLFGAMISVAMCSEFFEVPEKPEEFSSEEGCYYPVTGEVIEYDGVRHFSDPCMMLSCEIAYETPYFKKQTCAEIVKTAGTFAVAGNPAEPYPYCCPSVSFVPHHKHRPPTHPYYG